MLDIEYFEEEDGKRVLIKMPYDAAKVLLGTLATLLTRPIPVEARDALITMGDTSTVVQLEISPPVGLLHGISKPASTHEECKESTWHQGVCGLCGNADEVGYAPCLGKDICQQCYTTLVAHNLLERAN